MSFCTECGTQSSGGAFCSACGNQMGSSNTVSHAVTPLDKRIDIVSAYYVIFKNCEEDAEFLKNFNIHFILTFALDTGWIESNDTVEEFVNKAFDAILSYLDVEDQNYENLFALTQAAGVPWPPDEETENQ